MIVAFIADLLSVNRRLLEDIQLRCRKLEWAQAEKKDRRRPPSCAPPSTAPRR
jgi:hypothetical protein